MTDPKHTMDSVEWYTPAPVVERARASLGGVITLDPASCELAQSVVQARWACLGEGGLEELGKAGAGDRIMLNPPSPPLPWWLALVGAASRGARAVYVAYSVQQLAQISPTMPPGAVLVVPHRRIAYDAEAGRLRAERRRKGLPISRALAAAPEGTRVRGPQPPHASAIVLLGDCDVSAWDGFGTAYYRR